MTMPSPPCASPKYDFLTKLANAFHSLMPSSKAILQSANTNSSQSLSTKNGVQANKLEHQLPYPGYDVERMQHVIDARTLQIHHDIHHAGYVDQLNAVLAAIPGLQDKTPEWLLLHLDEVPIRARSKVRDNASGHLNHSMMWRSMTADPQNTTKDNAPTGELAQAIDDAFGSFEDFKIKFENAALKLTGSGWAWLVFNGHSLQVMTTIGDVNPITLGNEPLFAVDVWEHAYYLKYLNRRDKYLRAWWSVANWVEIETRYNKIQQSITSN